MNRHGRNLNVYYRVKEANMKCIVWFHMTQNDGKRQNDGDSKKISGGGRDVVAKHWRFLGQRNYSVWYYNGIHIIIYLSKPKECMGRSPGEGNSYPLQYSGLENSMDCIDHWGCKESDMTETLSKKV